MCGRMSLYAGVDIIVELFLVGLVDWAPRWNVAPTQSVPVVLVEDGGRSLQVMRWGLVPPWSEAPGKGPALINARSETVTQRNAFRTAFKRRRCLVPATGFYEWKRQGKSKTPFHITAVGRPLLALAGLWEQWYDLDGAELRSFTILTTSPNAVMAPIHDRMPVILGEESWEAWLDPDSRDRDGLRAMLRPCPDEVLVATQVSTWVSSWKNEGPRCVEPVEQGTLFD